MIGRTGAAEDGSDATRAAPRVPERGFQLRTLRVMIEKVERDATELIATYGDGAYEEARSRSLAGRLGPILTDNRSSDHWDAVRRAIARRTNRVVDPG